MTDQIQKLTARFLDEIWTVYDQTGLVHFIENVPITFTSYEDLMWWALENHVHLTVIDPEVDL